MSQTPKDHDHGDHEIAGITVKDNPIPYSAIIVISLIVLIAVLVSWVSSNGY